MQNNMKEHDAFHQGPEGRVEICFKPSSRWQMFADMAGHSCLSGEFSMINTFRVPRTKFRNPEFSPWEVLDRYAHRKSALPPEVPLGN